MNYSNLVSRNKVAHRGILQYGYCNNVLIIIIIIISEKH
jgi:hypothetical protein